MNRYKGIDFEHLDQFMPVVERVHGPHHEEIYDVAKVYHKLRKKLETGEKDLDPEFTELKKLTDNYKVPSGVCETYEFIYRELEKLNKLYEG